MTIPSKILEFIHWGWELAAELSTEDINYVAYIMVIPQVPKKHENPEIWSNKLQNIHRNKFVLKTLDSIEGYEIRYLYHHSKYTDTDWGWDYDMVLEDPKTRVRRIFIKTDSELEFELIQWLSDLSQLDISENFDSSLVGSSITSMLNNLDEYPHLWESIDVT